jgi:exopolysaccharide biosynthesis polyprenyl glycosylphosphotransferase
MSVRDDAETRPPAARRDVASPETDGPEPLLGRLNRRGFRLVMVADILALSAIAVGSMLWRFGLQWPDFTLTRYLVSFALAVAVFVASFYFGGLYDREPRLGAPSPLPRAGQQSLAAGGLVALLSLGTWGIANELGFGPERPLPFPIVNLGVLIVLGAIAAAFNRRLVHIVRTRREGPPRVLLVGSQTEIDQALHHLGNASDKARVVGVRSDTNGLLEAIGDVEATDVMLLSPDWLDSLYGPTLGRLDRANIAVLLRVTGRETVLGLERLREVGGMPFVLLRAQTMPRSRARFKRLFDVTMLTLTVWAWLPLLGSVALYQRIVAGSPVLFWQERVGLGGAPFRMVKFRTMVVDAEADGLGARLAAGGDDPRIIPACRWVRATRLDELPQLWNVLRGEMSLVGPRPERPELISDFEKRIVGYERRHEVPPGLTGLAQIHGYYHTDAEYKLGYDLQYLVNWSPVLDLTVMLRTIAVVLNRRS